MRAALLFANNGLLLSRTPRIACRQCIRSRAPLFFCVVSVTFAMNARLYSDASAVFAYSAADYDPWYVDCYYYYKPVEIFQVRVPVQSQCQAVLTE